MAYSVITTPVTGTTISTVDFGIKVKDNFDAAFPLGIDAWTSYSPANTNVTVGNGTETAAYQRVGRLITVRYRLTWGSTTAFGGTVEIGMPVAAKASTTFIGAVWISDAATRDYVGSAVIGYTDATHARILHTEAGNAGSVNATNPQTWATSDVLALGITYESAS